MKKTVLHLLAMISIAIFTFQVQAQNAWINELHYDNTGGDVGEFVEVVIENAGTYNLIDFTVTFYNGNNTSSYGSITVDNYTSTSTSGDFSIFGIPYSGIQNGAPDGLCIDYQGTLISGQFLSYEGTFTASGGPADGIASTDIGVSEPSSTPVGESLQLSGTGTQYSDFTWQPPATETPGTLNNGQTFGTAAPPTQLAVTSINSGNSPIVGVPFEVVVQAQDNSNNPSNVTSDVDVTLTLGSGTGNLGGTLIGTILIGTSSVTISEVTYDTGETGVSITATDDGGGLNPGTSDTFEVIMPIDVSTLSALRAGTLDEIYKVTGEVVLTFQQSFRNQKYIEDATAAILIDDYLGVITTTYNLDDGITGIIGTLGEYGNMTQFVPLTDPGAATSTGNTITPQVVTIDDLNDSFDDYEAELVELLDVTFTDAGATFEDGTVYAISDGSKALGNFRTTFYFVDYIGTTIPATADIVVLPNARDDGNYVTSRSLADFEVISNPPTQLAVMSVNGGADPFVSTDFNVIIQAQDALGDPAIVATDISFTFTTNGGDLGTVAFVGGTTTTGTILEGTSQVTVTGVQMAPAGTNVTITATDNNIFGLASGTSDPFDVIEFSVPDIVITEIIQNPHDVLDDNGEWFEVFNNTGSAVDMDGWTIKDDGSDSHIISGTLIVPSYGFAVLGRDADPALNGGYTCDYQYSGFTLGNGADEVVLVLPDGVTEVDRVVYDGGPVWPDPTGASMVFTGFPSEDNNDGTKWAYATFRESTYTGDAGDRGSPGTNGYDQIMTGGFKLDLKVFLEGPYNTVNDSMGNDLRSEGLLPLYQPFDPVLPYYGNNNPMWQYSGIDTITYIPYYAVDWVLIELRDASSAAGAGSGTKIAQYPAYLMADGKVVSLNGSTPLNVNLTITNHLFVVIWHRNHLSIMNATGLNPVDGTVETYDFSTGSGQVHGGAAGYKELETNVWGMVTGDVNADGTINADDKGNGWSTDAGASGYLGGDLNLNTQSNNQDKNDFWLPNEGTSSQVPN